MSIASRQNGEIASIHRQNDTPASKMSMPNVDEEQRQLENGPSPKIFGTWYPQLKTEGVGHQKRYLSNSNDLARHVECQCKGDNRVRVDACIENHGCLDSEDDSENRPFFSRLER